MTGNAIGPLRGGSLFTGTAALDMAAAAVLDARPVWFVDNDPAATRLLAHHHPDVPNLGDITTVDWSTVAPVDVLTGGFPCQDISNAGRREGITGARSALWTHYAHAISALRPRYVLVENVAVLLVRGFDTVAADLARLGYRFAWCVLGAADVGAPHRRNRIFITATADTDDERHQRPRPARRRRLGPADHSRPPAHTEGDGRGERRPEPAGQLGRPHAAQRSASATDTERDEWAQDNTHRTAAPGSRGGTDWADYTPAVRRWETILGRPAPAPTVPGTRGSLVLNPALPEWMMGLPEGWITHVPGLTRRQQLKLAGNGVVPHQATAAYRHLLDVLHRDAGAAA